MELNPKDQTTALIHLYRGEVARMTVYRTRLDTTTNWAVGTTAAMVSFALGNPQMPHFVFALALALDAIFLWMEARRYRYYELVRYRVRLMEMGFYPQILGQPSGDWAARLLESLLRPTPPVSQRQALAVRLRHNYLWLFGVVYGGWVLKLELHTPALLSGAGVGRLPGAWVWGLALGLLLLLIWLALSYRPQDDE